MTHSSAWSLCIAVGSRRYRSHGELQAFTKKHGHTQSSTHRGQNHRVYYVQICICELQRSVFKAKYIVFINLINKKNLHTHTHTHSQTQNNASLSASDYLIVEHRCYNMQHCNVPVILFTTCWNCQQPSTSLINFSLVL